MRSICQIYIERIREKTTQEYSRKLEKTPLERLGPTAIGQGWVKALVWFWIIDETLVLTSILSVCRLNEVSTCQVMKQVMIMVMMVMTTR